MFLSRKFPNNHDKYYYFRLKLFNLLGSGGGAGGGQYVDQEGYKRLQGDHQEGGRRVYNQGWNSGDIGGKVEKKRLKMRKKGGGVA